jgi:sec-independent protein translocase protein TatB
MFDFAWSEMAIIAAVALVVIGPKDLPVALRAVSGFVKKARRMAGEFQTHVDEMMRDADLKDVKDTLSSLRDFDFRSTVESAVDPDGTLRDTFSANPPDPTPMPGGAAGNGAAANGAGEPDGDGYDAEPEPGPPARVAAPPFVPPALVPLINGPDVPAAAPPFIPPPPPFIPPGPPFIPPAAMLQPPSV